MGGYTGTSWLDTVVAFTPGRAARVVGHLPVGVRYAAVTAVGASLVIAGGTLPNGTASRTVYLFDTRRHTTRRIASAAATTHAAAATLGDTAFIIGGHGSVLGSMSAAVIAIRPATGQVSAAGHLKLARSDLAAVTLGKQIVIAGGMTAHGVTDRISALIPQARKRSGPTAAAPLNVYAADRPGALTGAARDARALVYVPNSQSNTVDVIDQRTLKIVDHYSVGALPQHVTPSYDLRTLYVDNDLANSLTPIDPRTGRPRGRPIPVTDPYNLYFTPGGRYAIVVAEARARLDFPKRARHEARSLAGYAVPRRRPHGLQRRRLDAACELRVLGLSSSPWTSNASASRVCCASRASAACPRTSSSRPTAGRSSWPTWPVAASGGSTHMPFACAVSSTPAPARTASTRVATRRDLYITNRAAGSVSVMRFATLRVVATWHIPNSSPDMGGVSADGKTLWLSGRYRSEVYAIDTRTGRLRARIRVGAGPHGLCVWPQPGRYSLGHTGALR